VPACGYAETLTSSTSVPIITTKSGASISYSAYSKSKLDAGDHLVTVTSTLNNYPVYYSTTVSSESRFTLTVVDLCDKTSIEIAPATIDTLVAFAGYTTKSQSKYNFNDVVSLSRPVYPDFCGEKKLHLSLNGTETSFLSASNDDYIHFSPPADSKNFGV
jgi:hypothetical protein